MKGFGKKTLAMALTLALTLAVAMSLSVGAWAAGTPKTVAVGKTVDLSSELPADATPGVKWYIGTEGTTSDDYVSVNASGVVTGKAVTTTATTVTAEYTLPAGSSSDAGPMTWDVTVEKIKISDNHSLTSAGTFGVGTTETFIRAKLPKTITNVPVGNNATVTLAADEFEWEAPISLAAPGTFNFTAKLTAKGAEKYDLNENTITCPVTISSYTSLPDRSLTLMTSASGTASLSGSKIASEIQTAVKDWTGSSSVPTVEIKSLDPLKNRGTINSSNNYSYSPNLSNGGSATDTIAYVVTSDGVEYQGSIKLTIYSADISGSKFDYEGGTMSSFASELSSRVSALGYSSSECYIYFELGDMDGGDLYVSKTGDAVEEDKAYKLSSVSSMFYRPNGSGEDSELIYEIYRSSTSISDTYAVLDGTIYLESDGFMVISADLTTDDVYTFDPADFEDAFYDIAASRYDDYVLRDIKFSSFTKNDTNGGLIVDYDDGKTISSNKAAGTVSYYVEPTNKQADLADVVYVPGPKTSGIINIEFTATFVDPDNSKSTKPEKGVVQINVYKLADINIYVDNGGTVYFEDSYFEEYLEDKVSKYSGSLAYIKFTEMISTSKSNGYFYDSETDKTISSPGGKTYYSDNYTGKPSSSWIALDDLYYTAGTKKDTVHHLEVTITYYTGSGTKTSSKSGVTLDIIVGDGGGSSGTSSGSKTGKVTMTSTYVSTPVSLSRNEFLTIGRGTEKNPNTYVVFTSLPKNGKLWTNYGSSSQREVQLGVQYSLANTNPLAANNGTMFSAISYVPAYSRTNYNVEFTCNAYVDSKKGATITVSGQVYTQTSSRYFNDVSSSIAGSVDFLALRGITTGYGTSSTFAPNLQVTRADFVTFLYRAAGSPSVAGANPFKDVPNNVYYTDAVRWAVQNNITTGYSATSFMPMKTVTQQELLTFLYRYDVNYMKHTNRSGSTSGFTDANQLDSWAVAGAQWAVAKGVVSTQDGSTLGPKTNGTRATVALWLHRMLTLN